MDEDGHRGSGSTASLPNVTSDVLKLYNRGNGAAPPRRRRREMWTEVESAKDEENNRNSHATLRATRRTGRIIRNIWRRFASCLRRICNVAHCCANFCRASSPTRRRLAGATRSGLGRLQKQEFLAAGQQWNGRDRRIRSRFARSEDSAVRERFARPAANCRN